jgi:hypothetical protein
MISYLVNHLNLQVVIIVMDCYLTLITILHPLSVSLVRKNKNSLFCFNSIKIDVYNNYGYVVTPNSNVMRGLVNIRECDNFINTYVLFLNYTFVTFKIETTILIWK